MPLYSDSTDSDQRRQQDVDVNYRILQGEGYIGRISVQETPNPRPRNPS